MSESLDVRVSKFVPMSREDVFSYFTIPELLEKWCAPNGMTLKVPRFEAREGGRYRFEHTDKNGVFVAEGHVREFVPGERLAMVDTGYDPSGKMIFENLDCEVTFKNSLGGTDILVIQRGFPDDKFRDECSEAWTQCLDHLSSLGSGGFQKEKGLNGSNKVQAHR